MKIILFKSIYSSVFCAPSTCEHIFHLEKILNRYNLESRYQDTKVAEVAEQASWSFLVYPRSMRVGGYIGILVSVHHTFGFRITIKVPLNQIFSNFHTLLCTIKYRQSLIIVYFTFTVHELWPFISQKLGTFQVSDDI